MAAKSRKFLFQTALQPGRVDANSGVVYGVSLISEGPALGHDLMVDATTLSQIESACHSFRNGVKVKLEHSGGISDIVGTVKNIRRDGTKLVGDLHLLETAPLRAYVLELADKAPDTFGLSVNFHGTADGIFARCSRIRSVDLVADPAANPDGLFEEKTDSQEVCMAADPITEQGAGAKEAPGAEPKDLGAKLDALEARIAALEDIIKQAMDAQQSEEAAEEGAQKPKPTDEKTQMSEVLSRLDAMNELVKTFASKTAAVSLSESKSKAITFSDKVNELIGTGKTRSQAYAEAMKQHPDLHLKDIGAHINLS